MSLSYNRKVVFATVTGNALEYYDITLYGFFAPLLAPLFFPTGDPITSILASLGTFAAGFMMRPLGGLVFGHIGDKFGRRNALTLAIFTITVPTFIIGLLPTYESIGLAAPVILIVCRLLQGFCAGGEFPGAAVFISENAKQGKDGFAASLLVTSGFIGSVMAGILGALTTASFMPDWGWRLPFIMGALFGLFGFYIRYRLHESPAFEQLEKKHEIAKVPVKEVFRHDMRNLACTFGIAAAATIPYYIISIYTNVILTTQLKIPTPQIMLITTLISIWWILFTPFLGMLADRIGKRTLMMSAAIATVIIAYPVSAFTFANLSLTRILAMQLIISLVAAAYVAPIPSFISSLFVTNRRYSGIGLGYQLGAAVLGGTTPFVTTLLVKWTELSTAPAFYMALSGVMGWAAVKWARVAGK